MVLSNPASKYILFHFLHTGPACHASTPLPFSQATGVTAHPLAKLHPHVTLTSWVNYIWPILAFFDAQWWMPILFFFNKCSGGSFRI